LTACRHGWPADCGTRHGCGLHVIERVQVVGVLFHRDERMARIHVADVHEGDRMLVLVDPRRGNLPGHDLAEHAIAHSFPPDFW